MEPDAEAVADSEDPKTVCMNEAHSPGLSDPSSILISGVSVSVTGSGAKDRLLLRIGNVDGRRPRGEGAVTFESEETDRWDGRNAESSDVERTVENKKPSSPTSSLPTPPHSILLFLSMGVPRPTYFIRGQDPRAAAPAPVCDSCGEGLLL